MPSETGWKPIPLSLKILFVILVLWIIGSIFAISQRYELGLPFFGVFVYGMIASGIVLLLDIIAPLTFLYALWTRKSWGTTIAYVYMGVFILNSVVALFTHPEELGLFPILIPALVTAVFLLLIFNKRDYFTT